MTDRTRCLTVILDRDMRVDDVEVVVNAIKMLRFVESVEINVQDFTNEYIGRSTMRNELWNVIDTAIRSVKV